VEDSSCAVKSNWLALLLLGVITAGLLVIWPGQLAAAHPNAELMKFITLTCVYTLFLVVWKTHGVVFSVGAILIFLLSDRQSPESRSELFWQLEQVVMLACLGIHLIAWSAIQKPTFSRPFWVIATAAMIGCCTLVWIEARQASVYLASNPNEGWMVADQRIRDSTFILVALGGLLPLVAARKKAAAWFWLAVCLVAPVTGFGLARLYFEDVRPEHVLDGAQWGRLLVDLNRWAAQPDLGRILEGWCWATPWLVVVLMAIGFWRAVARGFRQRRKGDMPLAWLIALATPLLLAALLPASSESLHPIGLMWLGIALSVFAIADLALLLYEQLALPVPEIGPAKVPRV
jgi:hypothetical protein